VQPWQSTHCFQINDRTRMNWNQIKDESTINQRRISKVSDPRWINEASTMNQRRIIQNDESTINRSWIVDTSETWTLFYWVERLSSQKILKTFENTLSCQTGGPSDIIKAESFGEDPRATGGLVSNLPHPQVNKSKQHTMTDLEKLQICMTQYLVHRELDQVIAK